MRETRQQQTVWVTKYALTKGIFEMKAEISGGKYANGKHEGYSVFTREFATTLEEAVKIAENMRVRKIASLKKSITKFEKLRF